MRIRSIVPAALLAVALALTGCTSSGGGGGSGAGKAPTVLPVSANPIKNTSSTPGLEITYAAVQDNEDPGTRKPLGDMLELTLKNTSDKKLAKFEAYYEMKDTKTKATEAYYQDLGDLSLDPGAETTIYFDNGTGTGHYPENKFSVYRSSTNQIDFQIQVSADGVAVATAKASKDPGTGEKVD
jgi:phage pi2 protein 07